MHQGLIIKTTNYLRHEILQYTYAHMHYDMLKSMSACSRSILRSIYFSQFCCLQLRLRQISSQVHVLLAKKVRYKNILVGGNVSQQKNYYESLITQKCPDLRQAVCSFLFICSSLNASYQH